MRVSVMSTASPPRREVLTRPPKLPTTAGHLEASVLSALANCSDAGSLLEARSAIDDLFDQHPYDSSALCLLARELVVSWTAEKRERGGGALSLSPQRRGVAPGPTDDEDDEDEDDDEAAANLSESRFLATKRAEIQQKSAAAVAAVASLMSKRVHVKQFPFSPPRVTTAISLSRGHVGQRNQVKSPPKAPKLNVAVTDSGSDIPSDESSVEGDSADEADALEADESVPLQWKQFAQYVDQLPESQNGGVAAPSVPLGRAPATTSNSPPKRAQAQALTYDEVANGWKLDRKLQEQQEDERGMAAILSPSKLLSYSGGLPTSSVGVRAASFSSATLSGDRPYHTIVRPQVSALSGSSVMDDSLDSDSSESDSSGSDDDDDGQDAWGGGWDNHNLPPRPMDHSEAPTYQPPHPAFDHIGSFQYMRENMLFDSRRLEEVIGSLRKHSMRSETERIFTKLLGEGYMEAATKAGGNIADSVGTSGGLSPKTSSGPKKQDKEELGASPPQASNCKDSNKSKWELPRWGRGVRFASPASPLAGGGGVRVSDGGTNLNTTTTSRASNSSFIWPLHYASVSASSKPVNAMGASSRQSAWSSSRNKAAPQPKTKPKPIRYYISLPSTPTYKTASNARNKPLSKPKRRTAPSYKYPKPTPPMPPAANSPTPDQATIAALAAKAGVSVDYPLNQRRSTYINMRLAGQRGLVGTGPLGTDLPTRKKKKAQR